MVDYPESRPALQDAAACLRHAGLHAEFTARFRAAIQQRLLHAGAPPPLPACANVPPRLLARHQPLLRGLRASALPPCSTCASSTPRSARGVFGRNKQQST